MRKLADRLPWRRCFSCARRVGEIRDIAELSSRVLPTYQETRHHDLLTLSWPSPPRNVLLSIKDKSPTVSESFIEYANHIQSTYPSTSIVLEPSVANRIHESFDFPVYTGSSGRNPSDLPDSLFKDKVDLVSTLGGDGTILRASSLFAGAETVPPILSFSMGTLGFLGEWKFKEYKKAFREVYMSGAESSREQREQAQANGNSAASDSSPVGWASIGGKFMGKSRAARVLLRNRLKVSMLNPGESQSRSVNEQENEDDQLQRPGHAGIYAMNEVIIHRGRDPHLAVVEVSVGGRFLTEAVADGMIISTPTGSTAYSLSSGGSIVHPLVSSLLLTPICPRSLSFRPLVLPANTPITLRLSEKNRGREVEVSIDGVRRSEGMSVGMELHVSGEDVLNKAGKWFGGVPSVVRSTANHEPGGEDSWVGGLNGLLKFNYPFGEE